ncbi:MAG TPA: hypothetical protein VEI03_22505 [Stellaceae bacterium]|nr:hypothetical protein [Stellaceae bacterium]
MTRPTKKDMERCTLDTLLATLGIAPDSVAAAEAPDFVVSVAGQTIGVEVTMYQSGVAAVPGIRRRQVEAEWEALSRASRAFVEINSDLRNMNIGLMFKDILPGRAEHQAFMVEVADFVRASEVGGQNRRFWSPQFTSPLMSRYLREIDLRKHDIAEWYSNISSGFVGRPDASFAEIVADKSAKHFRPVDNLWLVIQCSHRPSETMLPINGAEDFDIVPGLANTLARTPFTRVYALTAIGMFLWELSTGWRDVTPRDRSADTQSPSQDDLMNVMTDLEWMVGPDAKVLEEADKVLRGLRDWAKRSLT